MELPLEISLLRIVAQGLVPATASASAHDVVRKMLATQGQLVSAVPHSLMVRTRGATGSDVRADFEAGKLVRSWPFRGTLHIVAAEDHRWLTALWTMRRTDSWWKREAVRVSLTEHDIDRVRALTLEYLATGPKSREELRQLWMGEAIGASLEDADRARLYYLLFTFFHRDGTMVSGPPGKNEHLVIDAATIESEHDVVADRILAGEEDAARGAYAEVARRYATTRGPVTADDLARWMGMGKGISRIALDDAVALTHVSGDDEDQEQGRVPLVRAVLEGKELRVIEGQVPSSVPVYYMRADLQDLLAENRAAARRTYFLAAFDELHVGYKDRSCLANAPVEKLICPGGNGMFRPLIVDGGRVVAVNPVNVGLQWAKEPSKRLETDTERAIRAVEKRLAR